MIITGQAQTKLLELVEAVDPNHISILVSNDPDFEKIPRGLRGSVNVYVHRGVVRYVSPSYSARFPIGSKWEGAPEAVSIDMDAICKELQIDPNKWYPAGSISVDAGVCWVGDPCYIIPDTPSEGESWDDFDEQLDDEFDRRGFKQFNHDSGNPGLGVCVSTGFGDGQYPVEVQYSPEGRIAALRVVFISDDEPHE